MAKDEKVEKAELLIAHILRWGVLLCAAVIIVGWIMMSHKIIMTGLLILIFLPIARVAAAALIFFKQKDYIYICLSTYVLIILVTSLLLGKKI
ncbi:MAG: DUF1634 domain-containing protein [Bacteriovorax sp.]